MKKKLLVTLLALIMVCTSLIGCGGNVSSDNDLPSKDDVNVEVGDSTTETEEETQSETEQETELDEDAALAEKIKTGNPNYGSKVYDETLLADAIAEYEKYKTDNGYEFCNMFEVEGADVPVCIVKKAGGYGAEGPGQVIIYVNNELQVIDKFDSISVNDMGYISTRYDSYEEGITEVNYYKWEDEKYVKFISLVRISTDEKYESNYYIYENGVETKVSNSDYTLASLSTGGYYTYYGDGNWYETVEQAYDKMINSREYMKNEFKSLNENAANEYIDKKEFYDSF